MADSADLIAVARHLMDYSLVGRDAAWCRAVSTAYYAVFHTLARSAADHFLGKARMQSGAYEVIYRSLTHTRAALVCRELQKPSLKEDYRRALKGNAVSAAAKAFCWALLELQQGRTAADYSPGASFTADETRQFVNLAALAIADWSTIPEDEQLDILALMMTSPRH